jgi:histidine triad (HIT) family protein
MRLAFEPEGLNLFQANGRAAWQSVFHFHMHVVPRWPDDDLVPNWTEPLGDRGEISAAAARLREALR